jgi:hypothetical protein
MKTSIKLFFTALILYFGSFINGCSDSTTPTINNSPPVVNDSVVVLVSPANNSTFNSPNNIFFTWRNTLNAPGYMLQYSKDTTFISPCSFSTQVNDTTHLFNSLINSCLQGNVTIYWRVSIRRQNPSSYAPWSETRHFTIQP